MTVVSSDEQITIGLAFGFLLLLYLLLVPLFFTDQRKIQARNLVKNKQTTVFGCIDKSGGYLSPGSER
jgi:hypothetical protein